MLKKFAQVCVIPISLMVVISATAGDSGFSDASSDRAVRAENLNPITKNDGWQLVWQDEFDAPELDLTKWGFEQNCYGGGNNEQQCCN